MFAPRPTTLSSSGMSRPRGSSSSDNIQATFGGGLSITGCLADFSLYIFHPYGGQKKTTMSYLESGFYGKLSMHFYYERKYLHKQMSESFESVKDITLHVALRNNFFKDFLEIWERMLQNY